MAAFPPQIASWASAKSPPAPSAMSLGRRRVRRSRRHRPVSPKRAVYALAAVDLISTTRGALRLESIAAPPCLAPQPVFFIRRQRFHHRRAASARRAGPPAHRWKSSRDGAPTRCFLSFSRISIATMPCPGPARRPKARVLQNPRRPCQGGPHAGGRQGTIASWSPDRASQALCPVAANRSEACLVNRRNSCALRRTLPVPNEGDGPRAVTI